MSFLSSPTSDKIYSPQIRNTCQPEHITVIQSEKNCLKMQVMSDKIAGALDFYESNFQKSGVTLGMMMDAYVYTFRNKEK